MRSRRIILIILGFLSTTSVAHAGLYYDEVYDNPRFQNDFNRTDKMLSHSTGVAGIKLPGDPMPNYGHFLNGTVITVDPGFQRLLWNYWNPSKETIGINNDQGKMYYPRSVAISKSGELFIADVGNCRIVKMQAEFTSQGLRFNWVKTFGRIGKSDGQFINPLKVAIKEAGSSPLSVFVSDWTNHNIQEFDADGNHIRTLGGYGSAPGQFMHPRGIAIMGGIYVADTGNGRIQRLNYATGSFEKQVSRGGEVPEDALFTDLAADHNQVYVVDEKHNQIYLFDQDLNYIDTYRGNPGSPFRDLRGISIFPTEDGFYHPHKAVTVEKDRIQLFRLGMDVKRIEAVPSVFYPPSGDRKTTTLKYVLTDNGAVRLVVRDAANNIVRKIYSPEKLHSLGLNEAEWDGKDDSGNILPGGTYCFEFTARDMNAYGGHSIKWVYKYCPVIIHETPVVTIASIDHEAIYSGKNAIVNYSLSQTGYVKAEVVNKDNTVIKTLKNEALENPGDQTVAWNGLDHNNSRPGDGFYTIRIQARDNDGYWGEAKSIQVALANTPPSIVLDAPNNNTFGVNAGITGSVSGFLTHSYSLEYSEDGINWSLILQKTMENEGISGELGIWETKKLPASEETSYQLRLKAWNKAGCTSSKVITVLVDNILPRISGLSAYPSYISPVLAATGSSQNASTITYLAEERNMESGGIQFIDQYAQPRQEFELEGLSGTRQWNGTDSAGSLLDDGQICCRLIFKDLGGNETSRECRIVIDTNRFPESAAITDTIKLTEPDENNRKVSWSADGTRIAYAQKEDSYHVGNIWMKNADGSGSAVKITNFSPDLRYEPWYPDIEPNGLRILFDNTQSYIYAKQLANNDLSQITRGMYARWSPDGTKIAFNRNGIIYLTTPEGIEFHQLTPGWFPSWSPDSKNILYSTATNPKGSQIYSITVLGGIKTGPLLNNAMYPEYSPDGNMLIYLNTRVRHITAPS